ncbi:MAG: dihydrofolate reductase family protein [Acidimicrobiales bacterium]
MRKLVVTEFISLDGVMEAPGGDDGYVHGPWTMPYWCDDIGAYKNAEMETADALLLGRRTYEGFAAAWPSRTGDDFSDKMNSMAKYVVSGTLTSADWQNTTILSGDMATEVAALKAQDGGDIMVAGSATLAQSLFEADLVDELRLAIYPITLGSGKKLFPHESRLDFEPVEITQASTGVTLTTFRRCEARPMATDFPFPD